MTGGGVGWLWVGLALGADSPEIIGCGRGWVTVIASCSCDAVFPTDGRAFAWTIDAIRSPRTPSQVAHFAGAIPGPDGDLRVSGVAPTVRIDGVPVIDDWRTSGRPSRLGRLGSEGIEGVPPIPAGVPGLPIPPAPLGPIGSGMGR